MHMCTMYDAIPLLRFHFRRQTSTVMAKNKFCLICLVNFLVLWLSELFAGHWDG